MLCLCVSARICRWAAKEAVFKAFGTKRLPFTDIEVVSIGAGMKPTIRLHGEGEREAARLGVSVRCPLPLSCPVVPFL